MEVANNCWTSGQAERENETQTLVKEVKTFQLKMSLPAKWAFKIWRNLMPRKAVNKFPDQSMIEIKLRNTMARTYISLSGTAKDIHEDIISNFKVKLTRTTVSWHQAWLVASTLPSVSEGRTKTLFLPDAVCAWRAFTYGPEMLAVSSHVPFLPSDFHHSSALSCPTSHIFYSTSFSLDQRPEAVHPLAQIRLMYCCPPGQLFLLNWLHYFLYPKSSTFLVLSFFDMPLKNG